MRAEHAEWERGLQATDSITQAHASICRAYRFAPGSDEDLGDPLVPVATTDSIDFLEVQHIEGKLSNFS